MTPTEVTEKLQLHSKLQDRNWYVHPSNAITGEGLFEGLSWLVQNVQQQQLHGSAAPSAPSSNAPSRPASSPK